MTTTRASDGPRAVPAAAWTAALFVAVVWAFLPMKGLPSFDSVKLPLLLAGAGVLLLVSARKSVREMTLDPLLIVPAALVLVALAAALFAGRAGALAGPLLAVGALGAAVLASRETDSTSALRWLLRGAAVASLGASVYALVQAAGLDPAPWGERRTVVATLGNTSFAAEFQAAALPAALLLVWRPALRIDRVLGAVAALGGASHLALARSRIDLIAAAAVLTWFAMWWLASRGRHRIARALGLAGVAVALGAAVLFVAHGTGAVDVPALGRSDTVAVRAHIFGSLSGAIQGGALLLPSGVAFADRYAALRPAEEYTISLGRTVETAHNDFLAITTHLGWVLALIAFAAGAALILRLARARDVDHGLRFAVSGTLVALFVSGLASTPLSHVATALLGALAWGAGLALVPAAVGTRTLPGKPVATVLGILLLAAVVPATQRFRSEAFFALARQSLTSNEVDDALRLLDVAASANGRAFAPRRDLGALYVNLHESELAEAALRDALLIRPHSPETQADLARALFQQKRFDEGGGVLADARASCEWHPELLSAGAQLALVQNRPRDAVVDLTRAARIHAHDPRMRALLAEAQLAARAPGAQENAIGVLKILAATDDDAFVARMADRMLRRDPTLLAAIVSTARRLVGEDPGIAAQLIAAAVAYKPAGEDAGFLEEAGKILLRSEHVEAGRRFIGRSLGIRAEQELARGQTLAALELATQAAPRDPDPRHYLTSARALARLGDKRAAVRAVGSALALGPVPEDLIRDDPDLQTLLPDEELELLLERAADRDRSRDGGSE